MTVHYARFPPAAEPAEVRCEPACGRRSAAGLSALVSLVRSDVTCEACRVTDLYRGVVRGPSGHPLPRPREDAP